MEEQGKDTGISNVLENEQSEMRIRGSEEMESNIACLLEKIESFTQLVGGGYVQSLWAENIATTCISFKFLFDCKCFLLIHIFSSMKVSELLESGKTAFKDLSNEFEERIIA